MNTRLKKGASETLVVPCLKNENATERESEIVSYKDSKRLAIIFNLPLLYAELTAVDKIAFEEPKVRGGMRPNAYLYL